MNALLSNLNSIDPDLATQLIYIVGSSLILIFFLSFLRSCLFRAPKKKKIMVKHEYHGIWASKIYSQEKGTIVVAFDTVSNEDNGMIIAEVTLTYAKESMYRPNQTYTFACELMYNKNDKKYYLRQCNFGEGQYFTLNFSERLSKSEVGYLTSISPYDLATLTFDKEKCIQ